MTRTPDVRPRRDPVPSQGPGQPGSDGQAQPAVTVLRFPGGSADEQPYPDRVQVGVLGTLTVVDDDGGTLRLSGPARRRLLAALVARCGQTVSIDTLVEDLWASAPPATAERTLQSHVVRLRDDLGRDQSGSPIITEPNGYRLSLPSSAIDSWCFERDLVAGRQAIAAQDPATAIALLDQALSWWRGDAYAEFADALFAVSERLRLHELRALATEARTDAALALGAAAELIGPIEQRLLDDPYRERSWEQLVLALYRSGRQGDALSAYRRARERLVGDLGLEPTASLRDLERRVLDQDPDLDAPAPSAVTLRDRHGGAVPPLAVGATALAPAHPADGSRTTQPLSAVPVAAPECPYRGLRPYDADDGDVFVGRERLTAELAGRLVDNDLLVVTGPSGAGKSSLLRAGLLPALRSGAIPGSAAWRTRVVTPGTDPLRVLDDVGCDLLVVDQVEELFTLGSADPAEMRAVGGRLSALLAAGTRVVLVVRGDFFGRLSELALLTGRIGSATALVGPLNDDETRRVVVDPAARQGVTVAPALVEEIIDDLGGRVGVLPLLSAALEQAWHARTGDRLTVDAYRRAGGVRGALENMAETTFAELDDEGRTAARRILLRLATLSGGVWVRRPLPLHDVGADTDPAVRRALEGLAARRLVLVGSGTVELTHESLLTGWPRLRSWLDERAVMAEQLAHLEASAAAWDASGRTTDDLLRGPRLQAALEWRDRHGDDLTSTETAFLDASRAGVDAELSAERRRRRRLTAAVAAATVVAVLASIAGVVAVDQRRRADAAGLAADARRLAAESYQAPDGSIATLLAIAGYRLQDSVDTRGALMSAVQSDGGALYRVPYDERLMWTGATPDGSTVLAVDHDRRLLAFDAATRSLTPRGTIAGYWPSDLSIDGRFVVTCGSVPPPEGQLAGAGPIRVVRTADVVVERTLPTAAVDTFSSRCGRFTLDGRWYVVADTPHARSTGASDSLAIYDAQDWDAEPRYVSERVRIADLATGTDRVVVRLEDGTLQVLRPDTGRIVAQERRADAACSSNYQCFVALTPDASHVAFSSAIAPQVPALLATGDLAGEVVRAEGVGTAISSMAFAPDGTRLASSGYDGSLLVQDVDGTTTHRVEGTGPGISTVAWGGAKAQTALYSVGGRELVSWNLSDVPRTVLLGDTVPNDDEPLTRVGTWLAGIRSGWNYVTDLRSGRTTLNRLPTDAGELWRLGMSSDGGRVAITFRRTAGPWRYVVLDVATGATILDREDLGPDGFVPPDDDTAFGATLSDDGSQLLVTRARDEIVVLDTASAGIVRSIRVDLGTVGTTSMAVPWSAPTEDELIVLAAPTGEGTESQRLLRVDPITGATRAQAALDGAVVSQIESSPDAARLAVATRSGTVLAYDATTLERTGAQARLQNDLVQSLAWSPDGTMLLTGGFDGNLALWDPDTMRQIGTSAMIGGFATSGVVAWYLPDGTISGNVGQPTGDGGSARRFTMPGTPDAWLAAACSFVGRDLTAAEWQRYVGDRPQIPLCSA